MYFVNERDDNESSMLVNMDNNKMPVMMAGYLEKRGKMRIVLRWKRLWFVLKGRLLHYYKSQMEYDNLSPCRGSLNMGIAASVKPGRGLELQVLTRSQSIILRASSRQEQEQWLKALVDAMSLKNLHISAPLKPVVHFRYHSNCNILDNNQREVGAIKTSQDCIADYDSSDDYDDFHDDKHPQNIIDRLRETDLDSEFSRSLSSASNYLSYQSSSGGDSNIDDSNRAPKTKILKPTFSFCTNRNNLKHKKDQALLKSNQTFVDVTATSTYSTEDVCSNSGQKILEISNNSCSSRININKITEEDSDGENNKTNLNPNETENIRNQIKHSEKFEYNSLLNSDDYALLMESSIKNVKEPIRNVINSTNIKGNIGIFEETALKNPDESNFCAKPSIESIEESVAKMDTNEDENGSGRKSLENAYDFKLPSKPLIDSLDKSIEGNKLEIPKLDNETSNGNSNLTSIQSIDSIKESVNINIKEAEDNQFKNDDESILRKPSFNLVEESFERKIKENAGISDKNGFKNIVNSDLITKPCNDFSKEPFEITDIKEVSDKKDEQFQLAEVIDISSVILSDFNEESFDDGNANVIYSTNINSKEIIPITDRCSTKDDLIGSILSSESERKEEMEDENEKHIDSTHETNTEKIMKMLNKQVKEIHVDPITNRLIRRKKEKPEELFKDNIWIKTKATQQINERSESRKVIDTTVRRSRSFAVASNLSKYGENFKIEKRTIYNVSIDSIFDNNFDLKLTDFYHEHNLTRRLDQTNDTGLFDSDNRFKSIYSCFDIESNKNTTVNQETEIKIQNILGETKNYETIENPNEHEHNTDCHENKKRNSLSHSMDYKSDSDLLMIRKELDIFKDDNYIQGHKYNKSADLIYDSTRSDICKNYPKKGLHKNLSLNSYDFRPVKLRQTSKEFKDADLNTLTRASTYELTSAKGKSNTLLRCLLVKDADNDTMIVNHTDSGKEKRALRRNSTLKKRSLSFLRKFLNRKDTIMMDGVEDKSYGDKINNSSDDSTIINVELEESISNSTSESIKALEMEEEIDRFIENQVISIIKPQDQQHISSSIDLVYNQGCNLALNIGTNKLLQSKSNDIQSGSNWVDTNRTDFKLSKVLCYESDSDEEEPPPLPKKRRSKSKRTNDSVRLSNSSSSKVNHDFSGTDINCSDTNAIHIQMGDADGNGELNSMELNETSIVTSDEECNSELEEEVIYDVPRPLNFFDSTLSRNSIGDKLVPTRFFNGSVSLSCDRTSEVEVDADSLDTNSGLWSRCGDLRYDEVISPDSLEEDGRASILRHYKPSIDITSINKIDNVRRWFDDQPYQYNRSRDTPSFSSFTDRL